MMLLSEWSVSELVLESRGTAPDKEDRRRLATFPRSGWADANIAYSHATPTTEPALWIADAVAGIVSAHQVGQDNGDLDAIGCVIYQQRNST
jgi:hypothetical protein